MTRLPLFALAALTAPSLIGVVALSGCDSAGPDARDTPPALIAPAAFALGDDTFPEDGARTAALASADASATGANFVNAAARVGVVSAVIGLNLALPSRAVEAVTRDVPSVGDDGVWTWSATVDAFGTPVALDLRAEPRGDDVEWRLVSTRRGDEPGRPFTYLTATTSLSGETGTYRLFHPNEDGPVLTAEFDVRDPSDRSLTFRVPQGLDNGGSSVTYSTDGPTAAFDWDDQPEDDRAVIRWDVGTGAGSITADTYNGGRRACWDADLDDVAC